MQAKGTKHENHSKKKPSKLEEQTLKQSELCFVLFFPTMLILYLNALECLNIWKTISELGKNKGEETILNL